MTEIIIPIKNLSHAKQRLAEILSPGERAGLVLAMLDDLLTVITRLDNGRVWVVGNDDDVFDVARKHDSRIVREKHPAGYNPAVALGLANVPPGCNVAILPGDVPLATEAEIAALIAPVASERREVRLVADRNRRGTNGLFLSSADLLQPAFGPDSFAEYRRMVRREGMNPEIVSAPGLAHDVDLPADLDVLASAERRNATLAFLRAIRRSDDFHVLERGAA